MTTSGTREWASSNVNCISGCAHDCKYCYAKQLLKRGGIKTDADWHVMTVREKDVQKGYAKRDGRIMFPTSHDIIPSDPSFASCMIVLGKLLASGNAVLVTTKPHLDAIKHICNTFEQYKHQIQFRFTITSCNDRVLRHWEPGAPGFEERLRSLEYARLSGYKTSVSIEPILDQNIRAIDDLVMRVELWCTESIWLGIMNRVKDGVKADPVAIYRHFQGRRLIRFKDSIRNAVGVA